MAYEVGPRAGFHMRLYLNGGTDAVPNWVEVDEIGDLNLDFKRSVAVVERRANTFAKNLATLIDVSGVTFKLINGLGLTVYELLRAMFLSGMTVQFAIMDDDISQDGAQGLVLPSIMEEFPWDQPLKEVCGHNIKLSTGFLFEDEYDDTTEVDPYWLVIGEGGSYGS